MEVVFLISNFFYDYQLGGVLSYYSYYYDYYYDSGKKNTPVGEVIPEYGGSKENKF